MERYVPSGRPLKNLNGKREVFVEVCQNVFRRHRGQGQRPVRETVAA